MAQPVEMQGINRLVQSMLAEPNLHNKLQLLVNSLHKWLDADACCCYVLDHQQAEFVLVAQLGYGNIPPGKVRIKFAEGLLSEVARREELLSIDDVQADPRCLSIPALADQHYHGYVVAPVMHAGRLIALIELQRDEAEAFSADICAALVTVCTQLSDTLYNLVGYEGFFASLGSKSKTRPQVIYEGIAASQGVAIAKPVIIMPPANLDSVVEKTIEDVPEQINIFKSALQAAHTEIEAMQVQAKTVLSSAENALFDAFLRILESRSLVEEITSEIDQGQWAQGALKRVIQKHVVKFEALDDAYLQERASDFKDLGRRILRHMQSQDRVLPTFDKPFILVSTEITATMLMEIPVKQLHGVVSLVGSSHSHVAILARGLGVPAVMGVSGLNLGLIEQKDWIIDGYHGHVIVAAKAALKKEYKLLLEEEQALDTKLSELRDLPSVTKDGHELPLMVNMGLSMDAGVSLRVGASGVGLYRTEMPFMLQKTFPSEVRQETMYRQLLTAFSPNPVVMRTLDIGGDKALPYFPVTEENPFLGWRGIRISLDHPEIFLMQVRAMLKATAGFNNLFILLPMITSVHEVEAARRLIKQALEEVQEEGVEVKMPSIGLMIEVPAAVYQAHELAQRVDFISVGSNDLIQYLLAVDRNNSRVAARYDGLHPAVLRALKQVVDAGHKARRPVSICGELASDPAAVILLLAMGFDSLSMNARSLLKVKWVVREFSMENAKEVLKTVLTMDDSKEVRVYLEMVLEEAGLAGLLRAGQ